VATEKHNEMTDGPTEDEPPPAPLDDPGAEDAFKKRIMVRKESLNAAR
jgi:hypothetical protein